MRVRKLLLISAIAVAVAGAGMAGATVATPAAVAGAQAGVNPAGVGDAARRAGMARMTGTSVRHLAELERCYTMHVGTRAATALASCLDRADAREWDRVGCTSAAVKRLPATSKLCTYTPGRQRGIK